MQTTTDYELGEVPDTERRSWIAISAVWIAIGIDLSGTILGIDLANGMSFGGAIWSTVAGSVLLGLMAMACAYVGAATGLSTAMISRVVFGKACGVVVAILIAVSSLGWFGVQTGFFADNARVAVQQLTGVNLSPVLFCIIGGALMTLTAIWGYRSIQRLSSWAVPLLVALLLVAIILAFVRHGAAGLSAPTVQAFTFGGAVSLVMSIYVLGVVTAPDIARWARSPKHAMAAGFVGFFIGNAFIIVVAAVFARVVGGENLMVMLFSLKLGVLALVVLTLAQWTTNTTNLYSASLSLSAVAKRVPRWQLSIAGGVIATGAACLGIYDAYIPFISAMGTIIAPFGGVYLADFFGRRRSSATADDAAARENDGRVHWRESGRAVEWLAVIPWVVGCIVAFATAAPDDGFGLGLFTLTSVAALDGLLVGFIVRLIIMKATQRRGDHVER